MNDRMDHSSIVVPTDQGSIMSCWLLNLLVLLVLWECGSAYVWLYIRPAVWQAVCNKIRRHSDVDVRPSDVDVKAQTSTWKPRRRRESSDDDIGLRRRREGSDVDVKAQTSSSDVDVKACSWFYPILQIIQLLPCTLMIILLHFYWLFCILSTDNSILPC